MKLYGSTVSPPCQAVFALLKMLDIPYEYEEIHLMNGEHRSEEFRAMNPFHRVPTLVDDGLTITESRVILKYIVDKFAPDNALYPKDTAARLTVDSMLDYGLGSIATPIQYLSYPVIFFLKEPDKEMFNHYKINLRDVDGLLGERQFLCGGDKMTIADIAILPTFVSMKTFKRLDLTDYTNILAWMERVKTAIGAPWDEIAAAVAKQMAPFSAVIADKSQGPALYEALTGISQK